MKFSPELKRRLLEAALSYIAQEAEAEEKSRIESQANHPPAELKDEASLSRRKKKRGKALDAKPTEQT